MYMDTVNVFLTEDSFILYKVMFLVTEAKPMMCDTGMACLHPALSQYMCTSLVAAMSSGFVSMSGIIFPVW